MGAGTSTYKFKPRQPHRRSKRDKLDAGPRRLNTQESVKQRWQQIVDDIATNDQSSLCQSGSLVVVGSGIQAGGHFTVEAMSHIEEADRVFYLVAEPATQTFIKRLKPDALDLFVFYGEGKNRHVTYKQITQVLLLYVRRGEKVVAVFYGHPGYLVCPSHEAVRIALTEGLQAVQLPAVSSLDCMVSELGFEPGIPGLQVFEATDLLMYGRPLLTDCHVIVNQAGCVGDVTFHHHGFPNPHLAVLVEYLQKFYGEEYEVYNYIGSQFVVCRSVINKYKLCDLLKPENAANIQAMSSLYIPPKEKGKLDVEMVKRIGMEKKSQDQIQTDIQGAKSAQEDQPQAQAQEKYQEENRQLFADWLFPDNYTPVDHSPLSDFLEYASSNPAVVKKFQEEGIPGNVKFPEYQAIALKTKDSGWIQYALKYDSKKVMGEMRERGLIKGDDSNKGKTEADAMGQEGKTGVKKAKKGSKKSLSSRAPRAEPLLAGDPQESVAMQSSPKGTETLVAGAQQEAVSLVVAPKETVSPEAPPKETSGLVVAPQETTGLVVAPQETTGLVVAPQESSCLVTAPKETVSLVVAPQETSGLLVTAPKETSGLVVAPQETTGLVVAPQEPSCLVVAPQEPSCLVTAPKETSCLVVAPQETSGLLITAPKETSGLVVAPQETPCLVAAPKQTSASEDVVDAPYMTAPLVVSNGHHEADSVDAPPMTAPLVVSKQP